MESKGIHWLNSPQPSRPSSPVAGACDHLNSLDDLSLLSYRSRARRDRPIAKDPQDLLTRIEESPVSQTTNSLKSPLLVSAPLQNSQSLDARYPKDEPGEETSDFARVWRVYVDEAAKYDNNMIEGCNRGIDVLLVFTGLFSAVVTTFIIQSIQILLPDPNENTNKLLAELVAAQTGRDTPPPPDNSPITKLQIHWVNGVWFAALSCSLSTALISMLAKRWLQGFASRSSSSPRQMARERQRKYMHLLSWHVLGLINSMPLLLDLALLLFFAGTIIILWSVDYKISIVTFFIIGCAYLFYFMSIWLPFFYPNCPYQHPIYEPLKRRLSVFSLRAPNLDVTQRPPKPPKSLASITDDELDAYALVWLFNHSTDREVSTTTLHAVAGLRRDFQAIHVLRAAGAVQWVEQAFQDCFEKDTTVDLKWHLIDPDGAWSYCKAWMNLTRGNLEPWPLGLLEPLYKLQDLGSHPDGAAIASCVVAVSSVVSRTAQWELLVFLSRYISGELHLSPSTLTWLLDSMIQGFVNWEMPAAIIQKTALRAVPILLRLLRQTAELPTSNLRSAIGVALYIHTNGPVDLSVYSNEGRRRDFHCEDMVIALSIIVSQPERFGMEEELWEIVAHEFTKLAPLMVTQYYRFTSISIEKARWSLYELLKNGRIVVGTVPDFILIDVLHLLNPLPDILAGQHFKVVKTLVGILDKSMSPDIANCAIQLLMPLLSKPSASVVEAFIHSNGIDAVLRSAKSSDFDNRRLQVNSWRILCSLVTATTSSTTQTPSSPRSPLKSDVTRAFFTTEFFDALHNIILARRWRLLDVSGNWSEALLGLYHMCPCEPVWRTLVKTIKDTHAKLGESEHVGMMELAKAIYKEIKKVDKGEEDMRAETSTWSSYDLDNISDDDSRPLRPVTMMEQRQPMKRDDSPAPSRTNPPVEGAESQRPIILDAALMIRQHSLLSYPSLRHLRPVELPLLTLPISRRERQSSKDTAMEDGSGLFGP